MSTVNEEFSKTLIQSLKGERGHIPINRALSDIDRQLAGESIEGLPYTIYQLLGHMSYWQDFFLEFLQGGNRDLPKNAMDTWPQDKSPSSNEEWIKLVEHFLNGIDKACEITRKIRLVEPLQNWPTETPVSSLRNIASHNTYHLGEIILIRRLLGAWPPPGGGYPA
ncbi:DinB family protein [Bacillus sp. SM2101]|uniref:DinB family protein n=1 Tax=Bacillus sp. SM2101 TaxID=2805366 RepID=UPI001BDF4925|nr:DinB family protein [Bacillus sp. SM2101]